MDSDDSDDFPGLKRKYSGPDECKRVCAEKPFCRSINIYTAGPHKNLCSFIRVSGETNPSELREQQNIDHYYIPIGECLAVCTFLNTLV